MAPRAIRKGDLKLSLVSCAVTRHPATSTSSRIRFNIIDRRTGIDVRPGMIDAGSDDEEFVPINEVGRIDLDESFCVAPDGEVTQEAFAIMREVEPGDRRGRSSNARPRRNPTVRRNWARKAS